eukprot:scaffold13237_cov124-Isochrysis_galbana.AAC.6
MPGEVVCVAIKGSAACCWRICRTEMPPTQGVAHMCRARKDPVVWICVTRCSQAHGDLFEAAALHCPTRQPCRRYSATVHPRYRWPCGEPWPWP